MVKRERERHCPTNYSGIRSTLPEALAAAKDAAQGGPNPHMGVVPKALLGGFHKNGMGLPFGLNGRAAPDSKRSRRLQASGPSFQGKVCNGLLSSRAQALQNLRLLDPTPKHVNQTRSALSPTSLLVVWLLLATEKLHTLYTLATTKIRVISRREDGIILALTELEQNSRSYEPRSKLAT